MRSFLEGLEDCSNGPGAALAVVHSGSLRHSEYCGLANLKPRTPITAHTNFRLASLTKQFTATAILLLIQEGSLSLQSPIVPLLPDLPAAARGITIRHLLSHTSGLADYETLIPHPRTKQLTDADVLALLQQHPSLLFSPGEKFHYSNSGYAVLSLIVEKVSGRSFPDFLQQRVFQPLEMTQTMAHQEGVSTVANRAFGFSRADREWHLTDQSLTSAVLGDGGIYSSMHDLQKWDDALSTGELLERSLLTQAFTPAMLNNGLATNYGFGWQINPYRGLQCLSHSGSTTGFRHFMARFPAHQRTIIYLSNRSSPPPDHLLDALLDHFSPGLPSPEPILSRLISGHTTLDPFS